MTPAELHAAAAALGMTLSDREVDALPKIISGMIDGLEGLADLPSAPNGLRAWTKPTAAQDPLNAFAVMTDINTKARGPLAGVTVALKDTVSLAGVPLGNGTRMFDGYLCESDALIVERLLGAGARIIGKTNCEYFCASGASFTCANGPVLNPWDPKRSAGGSSSGSAVAVAIGMADLAVGGDQGGSIRVPAALCGIVGLKPSFGRVPYLGVATVDPALDHVGPMARNSRMAARMLQVMAGHDPRDPRSNPDLPVADWVAACDAPVDGLRIGLVSEGLVPPRSAPAVAEAVRAAVARLAAEGATADDISIPLHARGIEIWMPVILYGTLAGLWGDGVGTGLTRGDMGRMGTHLARWQSRTGEISDILRVLLLAAEVARQKLGFAPYFKAHEEGRALRKAYDQALETVNVLAMPTVSNVAGLLPLADASLSERFDAAIETTGNTAPFNLTGHPAITVPCGLVDGLPVGLMFIARHGDEAALFRAAAAVEKTSPLPPVPQPSLSVDLPRA